MHVLLWYIIIEYVSWRTRSSDIEHTPMDSLVDVGDKVTSESVSLIFKWRAYDTVHPENPRSMVIECQMTRCMHQFVL